jgi:uridine kinase
VRTPVPQTGRFAVVSALAGELVALHPGRRVAVAVDGVDGAGKTVLADQLAEVIGARRDVLRVSVDGFHRPQAERVARGRGPESFYEDSYDYAAFRRAVLDPFRAGLPVTPAVDDAERDDPVTPEPVPVGADTLLLVDGIFLQRPELAGAWDAVVFVDVPFTVSVPRGNARFGEGHDPDPEAESNHRYVGGQRLYLTEVDPRGRATWVLDNTDLDAPVLHRNHP